MGSSEEEEEEAAAAAAAAVDPRVRRAEGRMARAVAEHAGVRTLVDAVRGCLPEVDSGMFQARVCGSSLAAAPGTVGGGFVPPGPRGEPAEVVVCAENLDGQRAVDALLVHELVHAYDHCHGVAFAAADLAAETASASSSSTASSSTASSSSGSFWSGPGAGLERPAMAWDDLRAHACSEIRAARLSGDCRPLEELRRGNWATGALSDEDNVECIKRRAALSVAINPAASPSLGLGGRADPTGAGRVAREAVEEAFPACYPDTAPFPAPAPGRAFPHAPSPPWYWDPRDWRSA